MYIHIYIHILYVYVYVCIIYVYIYVCIVIHLLQMLEESIKVSLFADRVE